MAQNMYRRWLFHKIFYVMTLLVEPHLCYLFAKLGVESVNRRNGIELGLTSTFHSLTTSPERIRMHIAVIGCGYWGPNHIRSFQGVTDCRVTAVDPDPSRLAEMSKRFFGLGLEAETEVVSAIGGDYVQHGIQDVVFINLRYPEQQVANIHASWLNPRKVRQMTIVGSRRMVTWDDLSIQTPVAIYDRGANVACTDTSFGEFLRVATWDGDVRLPKIEATEPLRVQSQYFVDSLRESTQTCSC